jgi:hypothetical protein
VVVVVVAAGSAGAGVAAGSTVVVVVVVVVSAAAGAGAAEVSTVVVVVAAGSSGEQATRARAAAEAATANISLNDIGQIPPTDHNPPRADKFPGGDWFFGRGEEKHKILNHCEFYSLVSRRLNWPFPPCAAGAQAISTALKSNAIRRA